MDHFWVSFLVDFGPFFCLAISVVLALDSRVFVYSSCLEATPYRTDLFISDLRLFFLSFQHHHHDHDPASRQHHVHDAG